MKLLTPAMLRDGAVLQRDRRITIAGTCERPGNVTLTLGPHHAQGTTDANGRFTLLLPAMAAGGPFELAVDSPDGTQLIRDIWIGDVWVCSGQSNMEMSLGASEHGRRDSQDLCDEAMRLLRVPRRASLEPERTLPPEASWTRCDPANALEFSAVGFYFGRRLREALSVPIGLIQAAVGATPGESWVSSGVLDSDPAMYGPILQRWRDALAAWPDEAGRYKTAFARWDAEADAAERAGRPIPGAFPKLIGPGQAWTPAGLFNAMIAPLTDTPIRGVIWYQGAGAPERATQYRALFRALIRDWRRAWNQGDFPFLFVQEAAFGPKRAEPCEHSWAELREAQTLALGEPATAMVVAIDTGGEGDIHPVVKAPIGERLALAARAIAYGQNVPHSGPVPVEFRFERGKARVRFAHGPLQTTDHQPPRHVAISPGATDFSQGNRNFVWAHARIDGDWLEAWHESVPNPAAIRYAWAQNPDANLTNIHNLPASPFRSDDYPGVTFANR